MVRRALLIGSQTYGLTGCDADVALMETALKRREFAALDVRTQGDASRAGILDGFDRLVAGVGPQDALVVYYSGHGGRVTRPDAEARKAAGRSTSFQFLVPFDIDESEDGDFRGLLSEELTALQTRLTGAFTAQGATPNVTVILDCCHSGYLVRDVDLRPKAVELEPKMFRMVGIRTRAEDVDAAGGLLTNPHAVRIVACQEEQSAFERASDRGRRHGALTDALVTVLDELDDSELSWEVVGELVRRRVQAVVPEQRPGIEGPARRRVFSTDEDPLHASLPVVRRDSALVIEAAALLGVATGDVYTLRAPDGGRPIGAATVSAVRDGNAVLDVAEGVDAGAVPEGTRALAARVATTRRVVAVEVDGPVAAALRQDLEASTRLTPDTAVGPTFATIRDDGGLVVLDDAGARARLAPEAPDDPGRRRALALIEQLALGRSLRELRSGEGPAALDAAVDVRFASGRDGSFEERGRHGERLTAGDRVGLSLHNRSAASLYFWVFDVGLSGRTTLVTHAGADGTLLGPAGEPDAVRHVWPPEGAVLSWPQLVPADPANEAEVLRPESLVIILADGRQDLSALGTPSDGWRGGGAESALDAVLAEVRAGVRSAPAEEGATLRYRVELVEFFVSPAVITVGP